MALSAEHWLLFTIDSCRLPNGVIQKEKRFIRNNDVLWGWYRHFQMVRANMIDMSSNHTSIIKLYWIGEFSKLRSDSTRSPW